MRLLIPLVLLSSLAAQQAPRNGPGAEEPGWHALVHARLVSEPGQSADDVTVVVRDGKIASVEIGGSPPIGARVWDCTGLTIYPAFIDSHVPIDAPRPTPGEGGAHWNAAVHPQRTALDGSGIDDATADALRKLGFGTAVLTPKEGIFRGQSAVVTLEKPAENTERRVLRPAVFHEIAFARNRGGYPGSQMGAIALIRQTLMDAAWHEQSREIDNGEPFEVRPPLSALIADRPLAFDTNDELEALRAAKIAREFERPLWLVGNGTEFRRLPAIKATGAPVILPLAFATAPNVETLTERESVTLRALSTWEQGPTNPGRLVRAGVRIALTTDKLTDRKHFSKNLRKAIENGLESDAALAALTTTPATLFGLENAIGKVAPGFLANFQVLDGDPFGEDTELRDLWVLGSRHPINRPPSMDLAGTWEAAFKIGDISVDSLQFRGEKRLTVVAGEQKAKAKKLKLGRKRLDFVLDASDLGGDGVVAVSAVLEGPRLLGTAVDAAGRPSAWSAKRTGDAPAEERDVAQADEASAEKEAPPADLPQPLGAFGRMALPEQQDLVIHGATIWTSGPAGNIQNGVLVVRGGKVVYAGPADGAPSVSGVRAIDARGKHITPGLIDCHSHTGISRGINEGSQAVTSEVRIGDVVNPDDIGWYRELAGGLTAVNQLHGSANPIGGQNSVVKLRWGVDHPDDMKIKGAIGGIKFALGENVKRSRSPDNTRYPTTRMGVDTLIRDRFLAARDWDAAQKRYAALSAEAKRNTHPPRVDLELEALAEILNGERLIHCHSYRQDEILALCLVAKDFGFRIGTFQHGLEGYKVAEAIRDAAIGASIFTDWWAYKMEVFDAIPENGAIMRDVGVVVSFNSDSGELARRMNTEAAKAVKYGGVPPAEALKFVTINPAKQLKVDDRVGSLEVGKDADFAVWSGDPLSTLSKCLETYIDGRRYFSIQEDAQLRVVAEAERQRLIQKVLQLDEGERGATAVAAGGDEQTLDLQCGDCGCSLLMGGAK